MIRTPKVPDNEVATVVMSVAAAEGFDLSGDHLDKIVAEADGNMRRALVFLETFAMQRRAGNATGPTPPEWERYTDALCEIILR